MLSEPRARLFFEGATTEFFDQIPDRGDEFLKAKKVTFRSLARIQRCTTCTPVSTLKGIITVEKISLVIICLFTLLIVACVTFLQFTQYAVFWANILGQGYIPDWGFYRPALDPLL